MIHTLVPATALSMPAVPVTNGVFTINPLLFKRMPFDAYTDFAPITLIAAAGQVLIVHPSLPAKTAQDVAALARAKPGFYNFGSGGIGISLKF